MKIISDKNKLISFIKNEKNLGFVPTMGTIHAGHASLINKSLNQCNKTLVTIFVNKPQFNKKQDFKRYPRDLKSDISTLKKLKVNFLYLPSHNQIYPKGPNRKIKINSFKKKLCGKNRKGHFEAVVDVINRFTKIIKPKKIYFGQKDYQQLKIIEDFIKKNYTNVQIISCKTVRDNDGVALSSRNLLLSPKQRVIASKVYKILLGRKKNIINKKISLNNIKKHIIKLGVNKIDYLQVLDINKIIKPFKIKKKNKIFIAYFLNSTRLIDNI